MKYLKYQMYILPIILFMHYLSPALLVFERHNNGLQPLNKENSAFNQIISEIILKYEWPMVIASASELSPEEKTELFAENPKAEEQFIEKKINGELAKQKKSLTAPPKEYCVIWIPTALYELFAILMVLEPNKNFNKQGLKNRSDSLKKILDEDADKTTKPTEFDLTPILNQNKIDAAIIKNQVNTRYTQANQNLFGATSNAYLFINNEIIIWFRHVANPRLFLEGTPKTIAEKIKQNMNAYVKNLIDSLTNMINQDNINWLPSMDNMTIRNSLKNCINYLKDEDKTQIIKKTIQLEYKAHGENKALLLRGSKKFQVQTAIGTKPATKEIIGSILRRSKDVPYQYAHTTKPSPYSISFGNGLFDGIIKDGGACVYEYLNTLKTGYALIIDKENYIKNQCNNLFFISALAPLTSLFYKGEYFHSRSKAARLKQNQDTPSQQYSVGGIFGIKLSDPAEIILIERDPLYHAELFSRYLAHNGYLIQLGDVSALTQQEKDFARDLLQSQTKTADFYKNARTLFPTIQRAINEYKRERFDNAALKTIALEQGYGYQTAYLHTMNHLLKRLEKYSFTYEIKTPTFITIPSPNIQSFLKKECQYDFETAWRELVQQYFSMSQSRRQAVEQQQLPEKFLADCSNLKEKLVSAVNNFIQQTKTLNFNASMQSDKHAPLPNRCYAVILDIIDHRLHLLMGLAHQPVKWELLGGTIDNTDKDPVDGAIRELHEESMKVFSDKLDKEKLTFLASINYNSLEAKIGSHKHYFYRDSYKSQYDYPSHLSGITNLYSLDLSKEQDMTPLFSQEFVNFFFAETNKLDEKILQQLSETVENSKIEDNKDNTEILKEPVDIKKKLHKNNIQQIKKDNLKALQQLKKDKLKALQQSKEDKLKVLQQLKEDKLKVLQQLKEDKLKALQQLKEDNLTDIICYYRWMNHNDHPSKEEAACQEMIDFLWVDVQKLYQTIKNNTKNITINGSALDPYTKMNLALVLKSVLDHYNQSSKSLTPVKQPNTPDIDAFIANTQKANKQLTVWGNNQAHPVYNVQPTNAALLEAIRDALAASLSEESLTQQLKLLKSDFFTEPLSTPILIQHMPSLPDEQVASGRLFTQEPEGDRFIKRNPLGFRQGKTGITMIKSCHGYNTTASNQQANFDTFYIDKEKRIYAVIQVKKNEPSAQSPSLSQGDLVDLKQFADVAQSLYRQPMIIDFVINHNQKTIAITNIQQMESTSITDNIKDYPLPMQLSLSKNFLLKSYKPINKPTKPSALTSWKKLFDRMKNQEDTTKGLDSINKLEQHLSWLLSNNMQPDKPESIINDIQRYAHNLLGKIRNEIEKVKKDTTDEGYHSYPSYIRRLFYIKLLENLLYQPTNQNIVNAASAVNLILTNQKLSSKDFFDTITAVFDSENDINTFIANNNEVVNRHLDALKNDRDLALEIIENWSNSALPKVFIQNALSNKNLEINNIFEELIAINRTVNKAKNKQPHVALHLSIFNDYIASHLDAIVAEIKTNNKLAKYIINNYDVFKNEHYKKLLEAAIPLADEPTMLRTITDYPESIEKFADRLDAIKKVLGAQIRYAEIIIKQQDGFNEDLVEAALANADQKSILSAITRIKDKQIIKSSVLNYFEKNYKNSPITIEYILKKPSEYHPVLRDLVIKDELTTNFSKTANALFQDHATSFYFSHSFSQTDKTIYTKVYHTLSSEEKQKLISGVSNNHLAVIKFVIFAEDFSNDPSLLLKNPDNLINAIAKKDPNSLLITAFSQAFTAAAWDLNYLPAYIKNTVNFSSAQAIVNTPAKYPQAMINAALENPQIISSIIDQSNPARQLLASTPNTTQMLYQRHIENLQQIPTLFLLNIEQYPPLIQKTITEDTFIIKILNQLKNNRTNKEFIDALQNMNSTAQSYYTNYIAKNKNHAPTIVQSLDRYPAFIQKAAFENQEVTKNILLNQAKHTAENISQALKNIKELSVPQSYEHTYTLLTKKILELPAVDQINFIDRNQLFIDDIFKNPSCYKKLSTEAIEHITTKYPEKIASFLGTINNYTDYPNYLKILLKMDKVADSIINSGQYEYSYNQLKEKLTLTQDIADFYGNKIKNNTDNAKKIIAQANRYPAEIINFALQNSTIMESMIKDPNNTTNKDIFALLNKSLPATQQLYIDRISKLDIATEQALKNIEKLPQFLKNEIVSDTFIANILTNLPNKQTLNLKEILENAPTALKASYIDFINQQPDYILKITSNEQAYPVFLVQTALSSPYFIDNLMQKTPDKKILFLDNSLHLKSMITKNPAIYESIIEQILLNEDCQKQILLSTQLENLILKQKITIKTEIEQSYVNAIKANVEYATKVVEQNKIYSSNLISVARFTLFINGKDDEKKTPIDLAMANNRRDVVTLLKEYGAIES